MEQEFRNWSGSVRFVPGSRAAPASERELVDVVHRAVREGHRVRPAGSGHSSMPLVATAESLVSLASMTGVVGHDSDRLRATVLPGTGLAELGRLLAEHGMAMENLGDVDYQAIAGAIGTGTHGTGQEWGNLSQTLVGGRLVTASGDVVAFGEDSEDGADSVLTRAAQVSLGSLGILSALTLRVVPAFDLHRINWCTHIDWVLENFEDLAARHRHMDVYWYPRSDLAQVRTLNVPGEEPDIAPSDARVHEDVTGPGYEIIPNARDLRFEEMEYMLPREVGLECFREVRSRVKDRHRDKVAWRVLLRTVAADAALISPFHGRETMTIATLQNTDLPYEQYFGDIEPMLQAYDGRPHWGKKHTMTASGLRELYPEWDEFQRVRREMDPDGVFMNDHLSELFEEAA